MLSVSGTRNWKILHNPIFQFGKRKQLSTDGLLLPKYSQAKLQSRTISREMLRRTDRPVTGKIFKFRDNCPIKSRIKIRLRISK